MKHEVGHLSAYDQFELYAQSWKPDAPPRSVIVIAHGFGEHSGRYDHVANYFVEQGYALYAADHRGHGESRGKQIGYFDRIETLTNDLKRVVEWVRRDYDGIPIFMLGHSVGGQLALRYTIHNQHTLKGLILSAPFIPSEAEFPRPTAIVAHALSRIAPRLGVQMRVPSAGLSRDRAVGEAYDADPNVYHGKITARVGLEIVQGGDYVRAHLSAIQLPILILHGSQDPIARPDYSQVVYDNVGSTDKTLKVYEGLYHEIMNEPEKTRVLADIWVWLAAH